jgi:hypothetical protein
VQGITRQGATNTVTAGTGGRAAPDYPGAPLPGAGGFAGDGIGTSASYPAGGKGFTTALTGSNCQGGIISLTGVVAQGGWGGGAAAFTNTVVVYVGGGGGYTGGDSGDYRPGAAGGGGGSFFTAQRSASNVAYGGLNAGDGYVSIQRLLA